MSLQRQPLLLIAVAAGVYYLLFVRKVRTGDELAGAAHPVSIVGGVSMTTPIVPSRPPRARRHPLADGLPL